MTLASVREMPSAAVIKSVVMTLDKGIVLSLRNWMSRIVTIPMSLEDILPSSVTTLAYDHRVISCSEQAI